MNLDNYFLNVTLQYDIIICMNEKKGELSKILANRFGLNSDLINSLASTGKAQDILSAAVILFDLKRITNKNDIKKKDK